MADLKPITERIDQLLETRDSALEVLNSIEAKNGARFDLAHQFSNTQKSFSEVDGRVVLICEMFKSVTPKKDALLVPKVFVDGVLNGFEGARQRYQQIVTEVTNVQNNGGVNAYKPDNGTLTSGNGNASFRLSGITEELWNDAEAILAAAYPLLYAVRARGAANLSPLLKSLTDVTQQAEDSRADLETLAKQAREAHQQAKQSAEQSTPLREEIERLKDESAKDRTTLSEYASEGTQSVTSIRSTKEEADQLKSQVEGYKADFDAFQKKLDQREKIMSEGTARQHALIDSLEEIRSEIIDINSRAEGMLSGATVAGLASSFGEHRDTLNKELDNARNGFYVAIALLFVSVLPLALYVIPGLGELIAGPEAASATKASDASELIGQIAARALLLLPGAWLTKFAANRYASVFKLKEHYVYKYSVATSVEGFKKQAEPYKDEIAAATFFELTMNPANRLEKGHEEERHPNPLMEAIMKRFGLTANGE